ncbi:MAG: hypothetical protein J5825_01320 [Lachnospiraceae bacterium]|jgi:hypothetical protein|nr:hypothetical protein [Lachnospiraceae bacterium]
MTKKLLSRIYSLVFFLVFVVIIALMGKGIVDDMKRKEAEQTAYEEMIRSAGTEKIQLTYQMLQADYDDYLAGVQMFKKMFLSFIVLFALLVVLSIVSSIFSFILKGIREGASKQMKIMLVAFVVIMLTFIPMALIAVKSFAPLMKIFADEEQATIGFETITVVRKETKQVTVGSGEDQEKRTQYYLIDENGKDHQVGEALYNRCESAGVYYLGKTTKGNIFSIYPDKYFKPCDPASLPTN